MVLAGTTQPDRHGDKRYPPSSLRFIILILKGKYHSPRRLAGNKLEVIDTSDDDKETSGTFAAPTSRLRCCGGSLTITGKPDRRLTMKKSLSLASLFLLASQAVAGIPATPVMILYQFNGALDIPYYDIDDFQRVGASSPAGSLSQGTSLIPCLVIRNGKPLSDSTGTPYVGFQIVVDSRTATPASTDRFKQVLAQRSGLTVANHHCDGSVRHVIDVRRLYAMEKGPFFDRPSGSGQRKPQHTEQGQLDAIIRAFHNSSDCENANRELTGRRTGLQRAWSSFTAAHRAKWPGPQIEQAKHLDYVMRTAIFEGHLDRGCNAYGSCERNIIALSIRNRGRSGCIGNQGCGMEGDFQGVSSKVSQYNIWDEFLTQTSGLTSCFLRDGLETGPNGAYYTKLQTMYEQNLPDIQRILFGDDRDLTAIFPGNSLAELKSLRHYYHAPAMGKCFPNHDRVEYITGAVARRGNDFALLANTRIRIDKETKDGYLFRSFRVEPKDDRDVVEIVDSYPGFAVDKRKVELKGGASCPPYGIPRGCPFDEVGRYRTTPSWLNSGRPLELTCRIKDRGANCQGPGNLVTARVGGVCDTQMRPVGGIK